MMRLSFWRERASSLECNSWNPSASFVNSNGSMSISPLENMAEAKSKVTVSECIEP